MNLILLDSFTNFKEMASYIAYNRISILDTGPIGRSIGKHVMEGSFSLSFQGDRIYKAIDKVTHTHTFGDKDDKAQIVPGTPIPLYITGVLHVFSILISFINTIYYLIFYNRYIS